ncbi:MAG: hypothetical protein H7Z42_15955 [Roseiflexaceae bacterium]|nr:hypothetical protein [Roseiflexaceae bacterium]
MKLLRLLMTLSLLASTLASCGGGPLLTDSSGSVVVDRDAGTAAVLSYQLGRPATISVFLADSTGQRFILRDGEARTASSDPYTLRFDGTAPTDDPQILQRALPSGAYTYTIEATAADGQAATSSGALLIRGRDIEPPQVENLLVSPAAISPDSDGIDDTAEITYQLPVTATVDLFVAPPGGGNIIPIIAAEQQEPMPQVARWDGKTADGGLLPTGSYTYTLRAQDDFGNIVRRQGQIAITSSGQPEATITYSAIAPARVELGNLITVTLRVKNTGDVAIRTYGPPSGYQYSTNDVFSAIEDGQYVQKPGGFWRVGVDWDANTTAGPRRYPFRWAISPRPPEQWATPFVEDMLQPGEEASVIGRIKVDQPETKMGFYVGLTWDGVGFPQDRIGRQIVEVGF